MPAIARVFPAGARAAARLADLAAEDEAVLEAAAIKCLPALVLQRSGQPRIVDIDRIRLAELPAALARRALRMLMAEVAPAPPPTTPGGLGKPTGEESRSAKR